MRAKRPSASRQVVALSVDFVQASGRSQIHAVIRRALGASRYLIALVSEHVVPSDKRVMFGEREL